MLDVGCGTGIDVVHLASCGVHVTAVDLSPAMLAQLRSKLATTRMSARVELHLGEASEVLRRLTGSFDGAVSSFAALNSIDLADFAQALATRLRPRARAVFHMLSPRSLRALGGPGNGDGRRPPGGPVSVSINTGAPPLTLVAPDAVEAYHRYFADAFALRAHYPLGFLVGRAAEPALPSRVLDLLGRVESVLGRALPLSSRGRFFVLDLERRTA